MRIVKSSVLAAGLAAATLFATACGGNDEPAAAKYTDNQACTVVAGSASRVTSAAMGYLYKSPSGQVAPTDSGVDALQFLSDSEFQTKLRGQAEQLDALTARIRTAVEAENDGQAKAAIDEAKPVYDDFLATCKGKIDGEENIISLRKTLDQKPTAAGELPPTTVASSSSKPKPKPIDVPESTTSTTLVIGDTSYTYLDGVECRVDSDSVRYEGHGAHIVLVGDPKSPKFDVATFPDDDDYTQARAGRGTGEGRVRVVKTDGGELTYRVDGELELNRDGDADTAQFTAIFTCPSA